MVKLSINVNKFALIRNSRGENKPNLLTLAKQCLDLGAEGITVHPRPDGRHIRYDDVFDLKTLLQTYSDKEFNVEGYPSQDFIKLIQTVKPDQVTLVPDPPEALTSSFGWNIVSQKEFLKDALPQFPCRTSIFLNPGHTNLETLKEINPDRIEIYTYDYAKQFTIDKTKAISPILELAAQLKNSGILINAGHDLDLNNLNFLVQKVPDLLEVSIGHAFVNDCIQEGLKKTLSAYLNECSFENINS
ncbi:pyridoxine 5'-phosphate synthase [bacterium]|nr:pyridoxine 5'-phosphate synthase [bacterium]